MSAGYQYVRGLQSDHPGEPERADVRGGRHEQRLPAESDLCEQQSVFVVKPNRTITACTCRSSSGRRVGTLPDVVHAVEIDEQRRRDIFQLADRSRRPLEGLGPVGRRPAASAVVQRCGRSSVRGHTQRSGAGVFGAPVQHHVRPHDNTGNGGETDRRTERFSRGTRGSAATFST